MTSFHRVLIRTYVLLSTLFFSQNASAEQIHFHYQKISFKLIKNLIVVEAFVNGENAQFIVDTGTQHLILNSAYIKGIPNRELRSLDFSGNFSEIGETAVRFHWENGKPRPYYAIVANLVQTEKILGIRLMGYIGHDILKDHEIVFDYKQKELTLIELDNKGQRRSSLLSQQPASDKISLKKNSFLPYMTATIGNQKLKLGIDSGASFNLLSRSKVEKIKYGFQTNQLTRMTGFDGKEVRISSGIIHSMQIDQLKFPAMKCVVQQMRSFNMHLPARLDGLLGSEFLKQYKVSINFRKNLMYIWKPQTLVP